MSHGLEAGNQQELLEDADADDGVGAYPHPGRQEALVEAPEPLGAQRLSSAVQGPLVGHRGVHVAGLDAVDGRRGDGGDEPRSRACQEVHGHTLPDRPGALNGPLGLVVACELGGGQDDCPGNVGGRSAEEAPEPCGTVINDRGVMG